MPRALLVVLAALVVIAVGGAVDVALYAAPFLVLLALLINGRFVGEDCILAYHQARAGHTLRPALSRGWLPGSPDLAASLFARVPRTLRGPPALAMTV